MEFFDVIKNRGSYRGEFEKADIPQEDLRRILDAGIRAPSGYNLQTTTFYAVTNETLRHALAEIFPTKAVKPRLSLLWLPRNVFMAATMIFSLRPRTTPLPQKTSCWRSPRPDMPAYGWTA